MYEMVRAACATDASDVVVAIVVVVVVVVDVEDVVVVVVVFVVDVVVANVRTALQGGSARGAPGSSLPPSLLPPPRITDRSSLEKPELRVEKYPPSKPVAPAALAGSCACFQICALGQRP